MDKARAETIFIENEPDLVPICDGMEICVSSQVLRSASQVFKAMLSPNFAEGQRLLNGGKNEPCTVPLPEDDGNAVDALCWALHRQHLGRMKISVSSLCDFAAVVDKYHCASAVAAVRPMLFQDIKPKISLLASIIEATILLDDAGNSQRYTNMALTDYDIDLVPWPDSNARMGAVFSKVFPRGPKPWANTESRRTS